MTSFFAVRAFVDDTIWVSSSQAVTQHILNITKKTVTIPLNQRMKDISLTISGTPIAVAKKGESYHYLGIFLSTEGLSKLSLLKAHSDVHFFSNVVLCKAISDKQFCYLVSFVLQPIVSYRTQFSFIPSAVCSRWNAIIRRGLKFKVHLPYDFLMAALSHPSFYGIKTFAQIQSESKSSSIINFVNAPGILGQLFIHKSLNLQVHWKQLDLHGPVPVWFDLAICFLGAHLLAANVRPCMSIDRSEYPVVTSTISKAQNILLDSGLVSFDVYTDSSVKQFGSCFVVAGAAAFFPEFGLGVGARVQGVMSSTLVELKTIVFALTCVPSDSSVFVHSDSQTALSACSDKLLLARPDF
ncbi:hypothetical protein G9A89_018086 [Geosiphon pyriformis]|nr:hypothetical protein G9A89_018086 [Geosiphon pyriformis]